MQEIQAHVAIGHDIGLQFLAWVANPDDIPLLDQLGIEGVCVDDISTTKSRIEVRKAP
jgi:hypothetical protein